MTQSIRVMLIEDNVEFRSVIQLAFADHPDIELQHQFGTAEIAIRNLETAKIPVPDLILLDLRLPGMDGLDAISSLRLAAPLAKIIILTQSNQESDILRAITLGASGYLLKSARLNDLINGIRTVIMGGAPLDANVAKLMLSKLQSLLPKENSQSVLSQRESEILALLAEGKVKKEIAKELSIGYTTVDTHVGRIYAKLEVSNAPSAVNKAHRMKIL